MSGPPLSSAPRDPRSNRDSSRSALATVLAALGAFLLLAGFGPAVPNAAAAATPMVNLGTASTYAVLSGASVGNTVSAAGAPYTKLRGDLGVKANTQPTGFPPGVVTGTVAVGNPAATQAHNDLVAAYNEVAGRTGGTALAGALAGQTILPGLHAIAGAASNTGTVTLDGGGDPNAVFVFQINGAMAFAAASHIVLTGGARASRVFWQVNGAGAVGAGADFAGTLMALDAVAMGNGTLVNGRAFARNGALTLDNNQFYSAPPVVTIAGGASAITTDTTPTISGTTDVESPGLVTVTVNGQTLTATPSDGAWSVTSAILANATYPVVASVSDGAGNPGSFTQQLTVDTVLPVVSLYGGPSATTNDPTPTIAGTSDVAPGTIVHVDVDSQTLSAVVHSGGSWNVTPGALPDGTHTITASVSDPAGNPGTDSQELTVDTTAPGVSIAGGVTDLTNDATPDISGTADVPPGTTVTVDLADETLSGVVQGDGTWTVTAAALSDGPHRAVAEVSDAAGNPARFTQTLTVDTVSPVVAISGGPTATTDDVDPTITGTSNAAPGTTVTVSIAGQTMTTLLQPNGTWNATPTYVGDGTWTVIASAPDPAGNVGSAEQTLVIGPEDLPPEPPTPTPGGGAPGGTTGSNGTTGEGPRVAALKKCKKKPAAARKKCRKKANKLP
jgi:Ice-binding-like/Bacterial Ig-like domain